MELGEIAATGLPPPVKIAGIRAAILTASEARVEEGAVLGVGLGPVDPVPDPLAGGVIAGGVGVRRGFIIRTAGDPEQKKWLEGSEPVEDDEEGEEEDDGEDAGNNF